MSAYSRDRTAAERQRRFRKRFALGIQGAACLVPEELVTALRAAGYLSDAGTNQTILGAALVRHAMDALGVKSVRQHPKHYVYRLVSKDGQIMYIGKGRGDRSQQSSRRHGYQAEIVAYFDTDEAALAEEGRLIFLLKPPLNKVGVGDRAQGVLANVFVTSVTPHQADRC